MSIIETMQAQSAQMKPTSPRRGRATKGLGDLSSFNIALENYKMTGSSPKKKTLEIEDSDPHVKYPDHEFTGEYIEEFMSKLKGKIEDRIMNLEKVEDLLPKISKTVNFL